MGALGYCSQCERETNIMYAEELEARYNGLNKRKDLKVTIPIEEW